MYVCLYVCLPCSHFHHLHRTSCLSVALYPSLLRCKPLNYSVAQGFKDQNLQVCFGPRGDAPRVVLGSGRWGASSSSFFAVLSSTRLLYIVDAHSKLSACSPSRWCFSNVSQLSLSIFIRFPMRGMINFINMGYCRNNTDRASVANTTLTH